MAGEMLDFFRPLELHRTEKNLNHLIDQTVEIVTPVAQMKKVTIRNQSPQSLSSLSVDEMRIKQVLINLLINAVEASPEGEIVEVRSYGKRKALFIEVIDCGGGIPVEKREKIFAPFFTTKQGGTGLGLPIAKKIVEARQGYSEVLNNSEKGAILGIIIPSGNLQIFSLRKFYRSLKLNVSNLTRNQWFQVPALNNPIYMKFVAYSPPKSSISVNHSSLL